VLAIDTYLLGVSEANFGSAAMLCKCCHHKLVSLPVQP